jgi:enoyl-CoA hydratase/crotonobetainyl-CoA hydratase
MLPIDVKRKNNVSWIIINREDKGNSLDVEHAKLLAQAITRECNNQETAVVALRGAGSRFFSTGVDLSSVASVRSIEDSIRLMAEGLGGVCKAITGCSKPFIAAVNGHAVGIGFEMVVASDLAYAVRGVKMGSPAVRWGMVPPASTTIGQYVMGQKIATYIVLTGDLLPSEELYRYGLLNGIVGNVEELEKTVEQVAVKISRNDRWAVREALRVLRASRMHHLTEIGLRSLVISTARRETWERARSFLEKNA